MTYIENIFLCMVSPLLVAALCMGRRQLRFFLFCIAGMGVCLLSAYINTFLAAVCQADALAATAEIAPVVEETMKLLWAKICILSQPGVIRSGALSLFCFRCRKVLWQNRRTASCQSNARPC